MNGSRALVVTSISAPNKILTKLAAGAQAHGYRFLVVGDTKSPADFQLIGCDYYSIERQLELGLEFADKCPARHYARKNIGYLVAARDGAKMILETDDDNIPRDPFWSERKRIHRVTELRGTGWANLYRYFTEANIWPRGLPLDQVQAPLPEFDSLPVRELDCPIQQGLADENPDVDAIYRLLLPLPQSFRTDRRVAVSEGSLCPFNSQNTAWFRDACPLMYLPAHCSFRMTDIWRSFVAQRIAWTNGWSILFEGPTVVQERNDHNLMRDFTDEVPGYLNNSKIGKALADLDLEEGAAAIPDNLRRCYAELIELGLVGGAERELVEAWLGDLRRIGLV